jgi:deoxyribose-phosphate aldolase
MSVFNEGETGRKRLLKLRHSCGPDQNLFLLEDLLQADSILLPPFFIQTVSNNFEQPDVVTVNTFVGFPQSAKSFLAASKTA